MLTAHGIPAMCVGSVSMLRPIAVVFPPKPCGPIPNSLTYTSNSYSKTAYNVSGFSESTGLINAFFASNADLSNVPPIPTPKTIGGHGLGPAVSTTSRMKSLIH